MAILILAGLIILATAGTKPMTAAEIRAANKAQFKDRTSNTTAVARAIAQSLLQ